MASSRIPGPIGASSSNTESVPTHLRGPVGRDLEALYRDSPGPLGVNDWAQFAAMPRTQNDALHFTASCNCNRDLNLDELCRIFRNQRRSKCESFLPYLNATFKKYAINTCLRKTHFLAQVGAESGELNATAEIIGKGKTEAQTYDGYKGRGLIQLTWKNTYKRYGEYVQHDFLKNKTDLETPEWATDSAGWYWAGDKSRDLNIYADKNDFLMITAIINGAFNGFDHRLHYLKVACDVLRINSCKAAKTGGRFYFPFKHSACYSNIRYAFAWGAWNDTASGKKGIEKSDEERKAGYLRFLELHKPEKDDDKKWYGFSAAERMAMAAKGAQ